MPRGAVDERARDEEEPQAPRMVEVIAEPAESVAVFVAMHRHGEVDRIARLEHDLPYGELHYVDDSPWVLPRLQKRADALDVGRLALPKQSVDQVRLLFCVEGARVLEQRALFPGNAAVGNRVQHLALDEHLRRVAGHFVGRVPTRSNGDIDRT